MIQIRDVGDAVNYVRSLYPGDGVRAEDLGSPVSSYLYAAASDDCRAKAHDADRCARCKTPAVSAVYRERGFQGRLWYVVRAELCAAMRSRAEAARASGLAESSRIPSNLLHCTFPNFRRVNNSTGVAFKLAARCAESGESLVLCGPPGCGKTHLGVAIASRRIADGHSAIFMPVVNMLDSTKDGYSSGSTQELTRALHDTECLVLDDLGMQRDTPWVGERLYEIINHRYNNQSQIVVTTNADGVDDFESMIGHSGAQIASRLREIASVYRIEADDYRANVRREGAK